jgi:ribosomal-protein-alanine N-acetyltransferase
MKIIKGTSAHVKSMHEIESESFAVPWTEISIEYEISQEISICLVAVDDNEKVIGHVYMRQLLDEGDIVNIAVRKSHRKKGIAVCLLKNLFESAKSKNISKITLEVRESNFPAINLYKKFGFAAEGIRKNYYDQPVEDGIIMCKYF